MSNPSSGTPAASSGPSPANSAPPDVQSKWEVGDIGFDTEKKLWFVQLYNDINQNVGTYMAKAVILKQGNAFQYEWKDAQGRAFWHVRERFFADQVESIGVDPTGANVTIHFKEDDPNQPKHENPAGQEVPVEFHHIHYAFHLSNKEIAVGNKAPFGFLEFYDISGKLIYVINNRWIIVEGVERKSVGTYPSIRLRIERKDVWRIITTRTTVIIQGKPTQ